MACRRYRERQGVGRDRCRIIEFLWIFDGRPIVLVKLCEEGSRKI